MQDIRCSQRDSQHSNQAGIAGPAVPAAPGPARVFRYSIMSGTQSQTRRPMMMALDLARQAGTTGEVPVGAVITTVDGQVIASAANAVEARQDATAHAEILAIQAASRTLGRRRLLDCSLYVTLEPCAMCAAAIAQARIARLYFGAWDEKTGAVENGPCLFNHPSCLHRPEVYGGINEAECRTLLTRFFQDLRDHRSAHQRCGAGGRSPGDGSS